MRDAYLYEDCDVLKNLLGIKDKKLLDEALMFLISRPMPAMS